MSPKRKMHEPLGLPFDEALTAIADQERPGKRTIPARPFLKWVGGKRSVLHELTARVPAEYERYCEPFLGGGALFFALQPDDALLSDINFHLAVAFRAVQDDVEGVIRQLGTHADKHAKPYYLKARERLSEVEDPVKIAALLIYLNKTCYNGLYRVNKSGKFNVPVGSYKSPTILDADNLRYCSAVLQKAQIKQQPFSQITPTAGTFYYLDPPYHEAYSQYDGTGFSEDDHKALAEFCRQIDNCGGLFMVSNSDTPLVRDLYQGFSIENISSMRSVSCKGEQRGKVQEFIIRNYQRGEGVSDGKPA